MPSPQLQGMVFDFDGVLGDTVGAHTAARMQAFELCGYGSISQEVHDEAHTHGSHPREIIGWVLKTAGVVAADADIDTNPTILEVVTLKEEIYHARAASGLDAIDGAPELVGYAAEQYGPNGVAIATTATRENEVLPFLRRYNLLDMVSVIVSREMTPANQLKPHPFAFVRAAELLRIHPKQLTGIEDSPRGVASLRGANYRIAIGLSSTHAASELGQADTVVASLRDVPSVLALAG